MRRLIAICAAAVLIPAVALDGAAQAQRGGQGDRNIVVPAPAVTISPPAPTVNVTTPPPTVNVTTPAPTVNVTVPGANDAGSFGITPGLGSLLGALFGLLGAGMIAWFAMRSLRHHMEQQAAQTRDVMHEQATLNREADLRRTDGERRAIAAAFLAEVEHVLRLFKAAQDSPADAAGFVVMPTPKIPIFAAYASRLHLLGYETVYAVTQAYGALGDLGTLRFRDPADQTQGELLRLHKQIQVGSTITLLDRANALLKAAANLERAPDRPAVAGAAAPAAAAESRHRP